MRVAVLARTFGEGREQAERLLEGGEVLAHLLLHRLEGGGAEGVRESPAVLLLLARQRIEAELEIARHELLHRVAVEANQLPQEADGKQVGAPALLLNDDLREHRMGEVFAGLRVVDDKVSLAPHHFGEVLERHIGARVGIIEPAVGVFLDDDRPALLLRVPCHVSSAPTPWGRAPKTTSYRTCEISSTFLVRSTRGFAGKLNGDQRLGLRVGPSITPGGGLP